MECKVSELVRLGHDKAAQFKSSGGAVSQLISDLATQLDVQLSRGNALAAENAGLKEWSPNPHSASMYEAIEKAEELMDDGMPELAMIEAFEILKMKRTPATDAFLAEVRASELESLAGVAETMLVKFSNQRCSSDMHEVVGWKMVHQQASNRAAQVRKGVQS